MYYITLNTTDEAKSLSHALLEQKVAVCTNWFPITCAYRWEGKIVQEAELVLIVKTQEGYREDIERVIEEQNIAYTKCVAEIAVQSINKPFRDWLNKEVPFK